MFGGGREGGRHIWYRRVGNVDRTGVVVTGGTQAEVTVRLPETMKERKTGTRRAIVMVDDKRTEGNNSAEIQQNRLWSRRQ
mmetsp:Transcript_46124/g.112759  ORF Transcript_46124/g.112759 Transcript_46124/m.112759 type:complete len:81 (-) Transcript_46124:78-320(-)